MKALAAALLVSLFISLPAQAQYSSAMTCSAYTTCYDNYGNQIGVVSCEVHGAQYVQGFGYSASNNCSWNVQPYVAVQCAGYVQTANPYTGQVQFAWQNYHARCPGR